nr:MAG TPA: Repressor protein CI [Caudoviricetes sp.]
MEIARKIYLLRTENGLTQAELAKISGVTDKSVSAWENGTRDPKIGPMQKLCDYFGIDVHQFIDEKSDVYHAVPLQEKQPAQGLNGLTERDIRIAKWFNSLPLETQKAILTLGDGPKDLAE